MKALDQGASAFSEDNSRLCKAGPQCQSALPDEQPRLPALALGQASGVRRQSIQSETFKQVVMPLRTEFKQTGRGGLLRPIEPILAKACDGEALNEGEILCLLTIPSGKPLEQLFEAARFQRQRVFGDQIFLYGFIYFSTFCQNKCDFCLYRRSNQQAPRYRKGIENTVEVARALEDERVHLLDLTMGEDPFYLKPKGERFIELVDRVHRAVNLPIMISPGVLEGELLVEMARRGVDWYACYQETFNPALFADLRNGQNFNQRLKAKTKALEAGMLIEEGLLLGVGENGHDLLLALRKMRELNASQVRAMSFRPQPGTPMARYPAPASVCEQRMIAIMRLCLPDRLIPASLDVDGLSGLKDRLDAGANVVTSVIPPRHNLAGVARARSHIEDGQRTVAAVDRLIEPLGLRIAPRSAYRHWLRQEKRRAGWPNGLDRSLETAGAIRISA